MNNKMYWTGQFLFRTFFRLFFRVKIIGKENIPADKGVLLCSNHINNLDPPLLGAFLKRKTRYMAKAELFELPVLKFLLPKVGAFPIKRGSSDRQAMRAGLKLLKDEEIVGVFPEGTRSRDGSLGKGLAGVGFFALRSPADVVPCAIMSTYKPFSKILLVYGEPIDMQKLRDRKASPEEASEEIMASIKQLLDKYKK